jgi:predicted MPP superfamily phosphohydrolase
MIHIILKMKPLNAKLSLAYQQLLKTTKIIGVWDNHDSGQDFGKKLFNSHQKISLCSLKISTCSLKISIKIYILAKIYLRK